MYSSSIHQPFGLHGLEAGPWVEVWVGRDLPGAVEERGQGSHGAPEGVVERHATADRVHLADADDRQGLSRDAERQNEPYSK